MRHAATILILSIGLMASGQKPGQLSVLSGYVLEKSGEALAGANIYIDSLHLGTVSNSYGFYSLGLPPGTYQVTYSFIGFQDVTKSVKLLGDVILNTSLYQSPEQLESVEITTDRHHSQLASNRMSSSRISSQQLKLLPAITGEPDLIKAIQLLPGVQATNEGLSSYVVRGGNYDQNLVILDEATIYNPTHLLGFFSIFNSDILKESRIYKGDIPSQYGGRLSSFLKVTTKEGNSTRFSGSGGIGTILSKLTLEAPIIKDKASVLISARRSYADIFLPLAKDPEVRDNRGYFYDLYLKSNYRINEKNQLFLSGYVGRDVFKYRNDYYVTWGNIAGSIRWNHLFSSRIFSNLSVIYSQYDYRLGQTADITGVEWNAALADVQLKYDFTFYVNPSNTIKFGISSSLRKFKPGYIIAAGDSSVFNDFAIPESQALEHGIYFSNEQKISPNFFITYGVRGSLFQNIGGATIYNFNDAFVKVDSTVYEKGELFNSYFGIEPRLGMKILLSPTTALKASYNHTIQYLHLISNTSLGTPIDIWMPSNPNIRPQFAEQAALGFVKQIRKINIELTVETYYKDMKNQIDYKDHANIILNPELEGELRFGNSESFGIEFMANKSTGDLRGMLSYSLSKTTRYFADVNNGKPFSSPFDRRHQFSILLAYSPGNRWNLSSQWLYLSGSPATFPTGRYEFGNIVVPVYSERNAYSLPAYHRLDLSVTLKGKVKPDQDFNWDVNFSIYNVYNRKNAWFYFFESNEDNELITEAYKLYIFPLVPSLSFNFRF